MQVLFVFVCHSLHLLCVFVCLSVCRCVFGGVIRKLLLLMLLSLSHILVVVHAALWMIFVSILQLEFKRKVCFFCFVLSLAALVVLLVDEKGGA